MQNGQAPAFSHVLISSPTWFMARLNVWPDHTEIGVYASTEVRRSHRWWGMVDSILENNCHRVDLMKEHYDPDMMFSEALEAVYRLYPGCPGSTEVHNCRGYVPAEREVVCV